MRGRGGTADALASGASRGNPVEVQILSAAPNYIDNKDFPLRGCGGTADAPSWGGGGETRVGSNPTNRTIRIIEVCSLTDFKNPKDTMDKTVVSFLLHLFVQINALHINIQK